MAGLRLELRGSSWHHLRAGVLGGKGWADEYGRQRGRELGNFGVQDSEGY